MRSRTPLRRWATRGSAAAFTAVALTAGMQAALAGGAQATPHQSPNRVVNPYSPAYHHPYRHGVVPTISQQKLMSRWDRNHPRNASANNLNYGGGVDGIGVTTGPERVYVVFFGSQWGTQSTNANGDVTLSGDPSGQAPYQQELYKGLGTGGELWSGVMTQYCDGVATGSQTCPASNTQHVAYPTGGTLAGVWVDESAASPSQASGHQLGVEAVKAASHFGNTTAASNRDAQYIIVSPHGTHPDGFNTATGNFCAWHDWNGDTTLTGGAVTSTVGDIAFTNSPYITDAGASCGQNFVNANGPLDGVSIVNGHEYAETVTDQNPPGGWTDSSGAENGDKCAWITPGTAGGSFDLSTGHGTFAMQTTWGNDGNNGAGTCQASHAIVTNGGTGNTVTVTNPGNQSGTVGTAVSLQMHATDSASGQTFTWSATGLPTGLSINSSSGLISGTPSANGTFSVTVTAKDTTNASGSASFTWTIGTSGGCTASQLLGNPGFETGSAAPWTSTAGVINPNGAGETSHSGTWYAWLDGYGTTHTDTLSQSVTIPAGCTNTTFSFWLHIDTAETTTTTAFDKLTVTAGSTTLATYSNLNKVSGYVQHSFSLGSFAGQTVTLKFSGTEDASLQTSFVVDDTAVNTG
jgi:putative Ig domain-containing protein